MSSFGCSQDRTQQETALPSGLEQVTGQVRGTQEEPQCAGSGGEEGPMGCDDGRGKLSEDQGFTPTSGAATPEGAGCDLK